MLAPERLERYFDLVNGRYVFRSDLRRAVIFGRNDLMQDAPISRLDLLVCRNTLMYFNAETQARILGRFHFALNGDGKGNGTLFLGRAEMLLTHGRLFVPLELKHRVFAKVVPPSRRALVPLAADNGEMSENPRLRDQALEESPVPRIVVDANGSAGARQCARARAVQHQPQGPRPAAAGPRDLLPPGRAARADRAGARRAPHRDADQRRAPLPRRRGAVSRRGGGAAVRGRAEAARRRGELHRRHARTCACRTSCGARRRKCRPPTRSCSPPTRSCRPPTRSCSRPTRSSRPPTRSCSRPTKSSRP